MSAAPDPEAERAQAMGAVAFLRLNRRDLETAGAEYPSARPVGTILKFPRKARPLPAAPEPSTFEDPRWAELHSPKS